MKFISTTEAAQRMGVSNRRIRQYVAEDRLATVRIGSTIAIDSDSVGKFQLKKRGRRKSIKS